MKIHLLFFSPYFCEGKYFHVCDKYFYICKGFFCDGNSFICVKEIFLLLWRKMWNWKEQSLQVVEPNTLPPPHFCEGNIGMETPNLQQSWETNIFTFVKEIFLFLLRKYWNGKGLGRVKISWKSLGQVKISWCDDGKSAPCSKI